MKTTISKIALASLVATGFVGSAHAATADAELGVNLTVTAECVVSNSAIDFGSGSLVTNDITQGTDLSIRCTNGTEYFVTLGTGLNANSGARRMQAGSTGNYVNYELYTDSAYTTPWSSTATSAGTGAPSATADGTAQSMAVYGRVPAQAAAPGDYTDTVAITVNY
jgi:spore coat protein U-like protein